MLLKTVYDKLVANVIDIDTSTFVLKLNMILTNKTCSQKKILILADLLKKQITMLKLLK